VLLMPQVESPEFKTGALYASLSPEHFTSGAKTASFMTRLRHGETILSAELYNVFEDVAYTSFAGLERYHHEFQEITSESVHVAGAGPTLFALFSDRIKAEQVFNRLKKKGLEAHLTETQNSLIM
jgi:4-diphosphocytidyl-2C-methyl-D-erythritol kinase